MLHQDTHKCQLNATDPFCFCTHPSQETVSTRPASSMDSSLEVSLSPTFLYPYAHMPICPYAIVPSSNSNHYILQASSPMFSPAARDSGSECGDDIATLLVSDLILLTGWPTLLLLYKPSPGDCIGEPCLQQWIPPTLTGKSFLQIISLLSPSH